MFAYNMKMILKSKSLYFCIALSVVVLLFGASENFKTMAGSEMTVLEYLVDTLDVMGFFAVAVPAIMAVVFLPIYTEGLSKKIMYYQILRMNRKGYYRGQVFSALLSVCIVAVVSVCIFFVACSCADASWTNDTYSFFDSTNLAKYIHEPMILWKLTLWYGVATILYCLPWPLIGMVVSLLTKNKYIIIASPFVVFMAWNYLVQLLWRFFPKILWLLPTQPLLCSGLVGEPFWTLPLTIVYPILYHAVLIGGLMFVYLFTMQSPAV